jgi:hypothetical protein
MSSFETFGDGVDSILTGFRGDWRSLRTIKSRGQLEGNRAGSLWPDKS